MTQILRTIWRTALKFTVLLILVDSLVARDLYTGQAELTSSSAGGDSTLLLIHESGSYSVAFNAFGMFGAAAGSSVNVPSPGAGFEFPKRSHISHLFWGGLWVGGIVSEDTLVSVALDGWQFIQDFSSSTCSGKIENVSGPADQNFQTIYFDTVLQRPANFVDSRLPLNLKVTQTSRSWSLEPFDDILIIEYVIENIGSDTIHSLWLGSYHDLDILHNGEQGGHSDDIAGFIPEKDIAFAFDNDGHRRFKPENNWSEFSQRSAYAVKIIDFWPRPPYKKPNFNWWLTNGNAALDFGPRLTGTAEDPFRDFGGFLGTPEGDLNKYYIMSHPERDYDQLETALDHSADGWLPPHPDAADFAGGFDTRFLLSQGGIDLAPSHSAKMVLAIVAGENIHVNARDYKELWDPLHPEVYKNSLDLSDIIANMKAAERLYRRGYRTKINSPPPPPEIRDSLAAEPVITWLPSTNRFVRGYDIFLERITEDMIFCDVAPIDTPALGIQSRINERPVEADTFLLAGLVDGAWYAVGVALSGKKGDTPFVSIPKVFRHGQPRAPELIVDFENEDQQEGFYRVFDRTVSLSWEDENTDIDHYNIYRFSDDELHFAEFPLRFLQRSRDSCRGYDIVPILCDSLTDDSIQPYLCAKGLAIHAVVSAPLAMFSETIDSAAKYHYMLTAVDTAGHESGPTELLTAYTRAPNLHRLAVLMRDTVEHRFRASYDSIKAYYDEILAPWSPEYFFSRPRNGRTLIYENLANYQTLLLDDPGRTYVIQLNSELDQSFGALDLRDFTRVGGEIVYIGSGLSFNFVTFDQFPSIARYGENETPRVLFGLDSSNIHPWGTHIQLPGSDSLFHRFSPVGADAAEGAGFPDVDYHHSGWYKPDDFNVGPIAFKGAIFPQKENTEILYSYVSGLDPVSSFHGLPVGVKYTAETHTAYTFIMSPYEFTPDQADEFFRVLLGDIQTDVGDGPQSALLPETFTLAQNYPNPFNPATTINFTVPHTAPVTLVVYNLLGQRVATLVNRELPAGHHTVIWDASSVASGIYFYQLKSTQTKITKKALLLK